MNQLPRTTRTVIRGWRHTMSAQRSVHSIRFLLLGLCCLGGLVSPVRAQRGAAILRNPYQYPVVQVPSPYWGYTYSYHPAYGDYLHGAADVIRSQARFIVAKQEANILREKYFQEKFVTRRKEVEHWLWERDFKNE